MAPSQPGAPEKQTSAAASAAPTSSAAAAQAKAGDEPAAAVSESGSSEKKDATAAAPEEKKGADGKADEEVDIGPPATGSVVDMEVFGQLLEIDDDESHEFSKTLAFDYITQAETTFEEIDEALEKRDLDALSRKGHFLKGSSAALGLHRVQHSCEAMQHFGKRKDRHGEGPEVSEDEALARCRVLLKRLRGEQEEAKDWIEAFYKSKE
ncbi:hypothetical protein JCM10213_000745 [Rhodosporidiobolus nylandii]